MAILSQFTKPNSNPGGMGFWIKQPDGSYRGGDSFTGQTKPADNTLSQAVQQTKQPTQPITSQPKNPNYRNGLIRNIIRKKIGLLPKTGFINVPLTPGSKPWQDAVMNK